jgi:predicted nucleotidyltransferase
MYVLNVETLKIKARELGFGGIKPLAEHLGLHRNTLDRFVRGASVLPRSIELIITKLNIPINEALKKSDENSDNRTAVMPLVEKIHMRCPDTSIFLFGSRSKGTSRKYSDFDLGIFSKQGLPLHRFLGILEDKEQFEDQSPQRIDCVNLNNADNEFIRGILPDLILLAGYERDRKELADRITIQD